MRPLPCPTVARPVRHTLAATLLAASLVFAACGEKEEPDPATPSGESGSQTTTGEIPGGADSGDAQVIDEWSRTLSSGDVAAAAEFFAIPSVAENGPTLVEIKSQADARRFNSSLPCGAELVRAESEGDFTVATFELTERPGGNCGAGTGGAAQTSFVIEGSKITEWRRVGAGSEDPEPAAESTI